MTKPKKFAQQLKELHEERRRKKTDALKNAIPRSALSPSLRKEVLRKTGGRCHLCGGKIRGSKWQADHVLAHGTGGKGEMKNYLPAHALCNNYRWHYRPAEFQIILKLGVWARTQIERETKTGKQIATEFLNHEARRRKRTRREQS